MTAWNHDGIVDGTSTFHLNSWSQFFDFLEAEVFDPAGSPKRSYIWRGQRQADWSLSTTLDRQIDSLGMSALPFERIEEAAARHLERFKYATRGRRGSAPATLTENEWWALGQHFGLATPLLDWTKAPFAALYFAYEQDSFVPDVNRAIYGLHEEAVLQKNLWVENGSSIESGSLPIVEIVNPMSDENQRLVSQGGCFTRAPLRTPVEKWVAQAFEGSDDPVLIRVELPNIDRLRCLQALDRMNINHLSLFPDLSGASRSTNLKLEILHQQI